MIWPGRRRPRPAAGRWRRHAVQQRVERVGLRDLRVQPADLLGHTAYLQLAMFETASAIAGRANDLADREVITQVAAAVLQQHNDLGALLETIGVPTATAMRPFTTEIERYRRRLGETGWHESVLTLHLATGILDDFFARLAPGMGPPVGEAAAEVLDRDIGHDAMAGLLREAVRADPRLASRLALWGRRIVGDTLLVARSALEHATTADGRPAIADERRVEPVLTDLIAAHSRRMDALGLTA